MPKMTDQEFDNLFREAANRISPPPEPEGWADMEQRLEKAERDARARNISLYTMVGLLLLYSFFVPDTVKFGNIHRASVMPEVEQQEQEASMPTAEQFDEKATNESSSPSQTNTQQDVDHNQTTGSDKLINEETSASARVSSPLIQRKTRRSPTAAQTPAAGHEEFLAEQQPPLNVVGRPGRHSTPPSSSAAENIEPALATSTVSSKEKLHTDRTTEAQGNVRRRESASSGKSLSSARLTTTQGSGAEQLKDVNPAASITEKEQHDNAAGISSGAQSASSSGALADAQETDNERRRTFSGATARQELETPSTEPLSAAVGSPEVSEISLEKAAVLQRVVKHPLFVRLALSPDFSSIDYGKAGKAGVNIGPLVEYGISPRFSISTGAIWSKKLYDQRDPEMTYGHGPGAVQADKLDANCRIVDFPLNVTYYLFPGRKTSLFVTAGASSYLMLAEKYVYTVYHGYYDYKYEDSYSNKNMEWFSMLNLSLGIQHQVGKRCFIQGEPFFKAPMKGVGQGKVDLASAGVFVSLKYWINP